MAILTNHRSSPAQGLGITKPARRAALPFAKSHGAQAQQPTCDGALIVGEGIEIKGGIEACQSLVVEGRVETDLTAKTLDLREGGSFNGTAKLDEAEIAGRFEGDLSVSGRLVIAETGSVRGTISYGIIAIAEGGIIAGEVSKT